MTGRAAETWHRFRLVRNSGGAYGLFYVLLILPPVALVALALAPLFAEGASGRLPLSRASDRELRFVKLVCGGVYVLGPAFWIAAILEWTVVGDESIGNSLLVTGVLLYVCGAIGWHFIRPLYGPTGKLLPSHREDGDDIVELKRLHPVFVAAVQEKWNARMLQPADAPEAPFLIVPQ